MRQANLSDDLLAMLERIRERLAATGKSERGAAKEAGLSGSTIRNIREGKVASPRLETLRRLAPVLDTSVEWLAFGTEGEGGPAATPVYAASLSYDPSEDTPLVKAPVRGILEAGAFRPVEDLLHVPPMVEAVPRDSEYPDASLVIFEVAGNSMNTLTPYPILPGARVIALDYSDPRGRLPLRDGMVVVLERTTHDGSLRELSAKQIELYDDRIEFCPRSINPRHRPIAVPRDSRRRTGGRSAGGGDRAGNFLPGTLAVGASRACELFRRFRRLIAGVKSVLRSAK